jgi:hypothetical protein
MNAGNLYSAARAAQGAGTIVSINDHDVSGVIRAYMARPRDAS